MEDKINALVELLRESAQEHHRAYAATNGDDPDWAIWYADYLHDKLPAHLGVTLNKSDIIYMLMRLDYERRSEAPGSEWKRFYARSLLLRYG